MLEAQCHLPSPSARRDARPVAAIRSPHVNWKGYRHAPSGLLRADGVGRCRRERHRPLRASPCRRLPDFVHGGLADPEEPRRGQIEMRLLTAHAGNGCWEDQPGPEGRQGANLASGRTRLSMSGRSRVPRGAAERPLARPRRLGHLPKPISPRTGPAPHCRGQSPCFAARHFRRQLLIRRRRPHPLEPCNGTRRIERFGGFFRPCRPPAGQWEIARPISCNAAARSWASVPIHEQTMLSEVTAALIANVAPVAHLP